MPRGKTHTKRATQKAKSKSPVRAKSPKSKSKSKSPKRAKSPKSKSKRKTSGKKTKVKRGTSAYNRFASRHMQNLGFLNGSKVASAAWKKMSAADKKKW